MIKNWRKSRSNDEEKKEVKVKSDTNFARAKNVSSRRGFFRERGLRKSKSNDEEKKR